MSLSKSGLPDLWILKTGKLVLVEVKRPGERPTELQEHRHNELEQHGFRVIVASSVNHVDAVMSALN